MGIGSIASMNSMAGVQNTIAGSTDTKSKNIQKEITVVQQQMQALSSKEELSENEKASERNKLQKKMSGLNTELKQRQEEFRKSQKREMMLAQLQENKTSAKEGTSKSRIQPESTSLDKADESSTKGTAGKEEKPLSSNMSADTELSRREASTASAQQAGRPGTVIARTGDGIVILKGSINQDERHGVDALKKQTDETDEKNIAAKDQKDSDRDIDTGLSSKKIHAIVSADISVQQSNRQENVIAKMRDGIVILKGEINQDEKLGTDTEKKREELEKMQEREQRARTLQSSLLGETTNTMKSAAKTKALELKDNARVNAENNAFRVSQLEAQASQQKFYVSLDT